jgi:predicted Zn-dependent protease
MSSAGSEAVQEYFQRLADAITASLRGAEVFTCTFNAEESDFVRFNRSSVRQAGRVTQRALTVDLMEGRRHASGSVTVSGDFATDGARLAALLKRLRAQRAYLPDDPFLLYATEPHSSERRHVRQAPDGAAAIADIQRAARSRDLVGLYAAGSTWAGFANSFGQHNWYENHSHHFDWSFYHDADKAVKASYAGFDWRPAEFERKVAVAAEQLAAVAYPARTIAPGRYRVYLAPAALYDIVGMLSWGGFSLRAHRTKSTPLIRMIEEGGRLDPAITIRENTRDGIAPDFEDAGFIRPAEVMLIEGGRYRDCLVSPRSAAEYGVSTNGAAPNEAPESVDVAPGEIDAADVLTALDTGLYVNNLWYLNYSDRTACRTTGLTRFATFWVEHGRIQAPVNVVRFDESLYRMLGAHLVGLTRQREMILDPDTYYRRSTNSACLPGAIVDEFTFTL